jgi:competence protein ComEC
MTKRTGIGLLVAAILSLVAPLDGQFESVRIQVIDVGQADGILVRTPNSQWVLIDAGQGRMLADSLSPRFGVSRLALAVGSHRHRDHINGMWRVLRVLPADRYLGMTGEYVGGADDDSLRAVLSDSIPVQGAGADTIVVDGVRFIVLPQGPIQTHENDNSVVVRLEFGAFSMLFTGDAEVAQRSWLVDNHAGLLDVDVLKASHHGSHNGTSADWLAAITPERVVISAGVHRGFRHPHDVAVAAYDSVTNGRVYCTNRHGTVRIYGYRNGGIVVRRQRAVSKSCAFDGTHY